MGVDQCSRSEDPQGTAEDNIKEVGGAQEGERGDGICWKRGRCGEKIRV